LNARLFKVDLLVRDPARMALFYEALFQVPFLAHTMAGHPFRVAHVPGLGGFQLVPAAMMNVPVSGLNRFQLNLELEDGLNLPERLTNAGGEVEEPPQRDGPLLIYNVKDPEGNSLVIQCPDSTPVFEL
jgi:predicted enzyme related to lactoylglutathione lyase